MKTNQMLRDSISGSSRGSDCIQNNKVRGSVPEPKLRVSGLEPGGFCEKRKLDEHLKILLASNLH